MGRLVLYGKTPGGSPGGWQYQDPKVPYRYKANNTAIYTQGYDAFCRQVIAASLEINKNKAGKIVTEEFSKVTFKVDILATNGDGWFIPYCEYAKQMGGYEAPAGRDAGGFIAWDSKKDFEHSNTNDGSKTTYPPWVLLAHELGHAIQFNESGQTAQEWLMNYFENMEDVEMDNIRRHETPIVTNLGLKPRIRYKNLTA